jgi:hypothetical protein
MNNTFATNPENAALAGVNGAGVCIPSSDLLRLRQAFQSRDALFLMQDQRDAVMILAAYGEIDPDDAQLQIDDLDREIATEQDVRDDANRAHYADEQGDPNDPRNWCTPDMEYVSFDEARRRYQASFHD